MPEFYRNASFLFLIILSSIGNTPCWADIYRYVDANGVVHFTDTPTHAQYAFYRKMVYSDSNQSISYQDLIRQYSAQYSLDEALVKAVIKVESDYQPDIISSKGAQGLMQLIPETARDMQVADVFNPSDNIRGGSKYLRLMLDQFDGDLELALAAYNAGPTAVKKYGGIPPYNETINYIKKVKYYIDYYRQAGDTLL